MKAQFTIRQENVQLSSARPIRVQPTLVEKDVKPHDHSYYEICLVHRGSALHLTPAGKSTLQRGHVIIMAPGDIHAFRQPAGLEVTNVYYLAEWLSADLARLREHTGCLTLFLAARLFRITAPLGAPVFSLSKDELLAAEFELRDLEHPPARATQAFLRATLMKLLLRLADAFSRQHPDVVEFSASIWGAIDAIESTILRGETPDLRAIAGRESLSRDYFTRVFHKATGWNPMEFFQFRRVEHAASRLLVPDARLIDIAMDLGYSDSAHFSRSFKRYRLLSPSDYRKKYGGQRDGDTTLQADK